MKAHTDTEHAIQVFEQNHDLSITMHDLKRDFHTEVNLQRTHHHHPICLRVKGSPTGQICKQYEIQELRPHLAQLREGRIQRCHAGLVEWVLPVWHERYPSAVLFAGTRRWSGESRVLHDQLQHRDQQLKHLLPVTEKEALNILESLRQLGARLEQILNQLPPRAHSAPQDRLGIIRHYLEHHAHEGISRVDLAMALNVSEDRCTHLVRELTGKSWTELVQTYRLRHACQLLESTDLSVEDVAYRSGFGDQSFMNRIFKRHLNTTPGQWRKHQSS